MNMQPLFVAALGALLVTSTAQAQESGSSLGPSPGLTLESAVSLAIERNERTQVSEQRSAAARARVAKARSFFFPDLTLTGTFTRRAHESVALSSKNILSGAATVTLPIFDARSIPLYRQAKLDREAAELTALETRRLIGFEAADAFLQTLTSERVVLAASQRLEFAKKQLADARARFESQLVGSNDVTRAELEVATAERDQTRAKSAATSARLALGFLLNTPITGELAEPQEAVEVATDSPGSPEARSRRLDIAAAVKRALALKEYAKEPSRRFIPSLGLTGQYKIGNEPGISGDKWDFFLGLTASWSVWDGGERAADRNERNALAQIADLDVKYSSRHVDLELANATLAVDNGLAAVKQAEAAAEAARKNAEESTALYRQGLTNSLLVADAGVKRAEAEIELARERYALALARLNRRAALGLDPTEKK